MSNSKPVKSVLISQPPPAEDSPYHQLARKFKLDLEFRKFIQVEGLTLNDFRKQGLNPLDYTAIIFTSKVPIDHFFRLMGEMRVEMPPETKYLCVSEATARYLQRYIQIRKRKLFVGERTVMDLVPFINKFKKENKKERYLFPSSEGPQAELLDHMRTNGFDVTTAAIHRTVDSDLSDVNIRNYDMLCFFSPAGIKSLFHNFPGYEQGETRIAVFGPTTAKEATGAGLRIDIEAPKPNLPSMTAAIEHYFQSIGQKASPQTSK
ncbi:MAG: uroporphyrinogen-III synthase [Bacteroidetes bacterium]|jgi:uroporphyrinogen-III synthase|nr:MAG: uroporphyrinogen-III synthase [Bacteroidota bacterium]